MSYTCHHAYADGLHVCTHTGLKLYCLLPMLSMLAINTAFFFFFTFNKQISKNQIVANRTEHNQYIF